jgi:hypothetical protein
MREVGRAVNLEERLALVRRRRRASATRRMLSLTAWVGVVLLVLALVVLGITRL